MTKKIFQIATLPERLIGLKESLSSIYHQADEINVMLNGHDHFPDFPDKQNKITWTLMDNSLGDAAKVYGLENKEGFIFLIDDDLWYPPTYADNMIHKYNQYRSVITLHGKVYTKPVRRVHGGFKENYHCLHTVTGDHVVDIGGSGVMLFHTDKFKIDTSHCPQKNMLDIWVGKRAKELATKIIVVEHKNNYLRYLGAQKTIWGSLTQKDNDYQVKILNSFI